MLMLRVQAANTAETARLEALHENAVKTRLADFHRLEASALRAATLRARAAKHERKVLAVRTRNVCEELARHTLSLRLARSSKQSAAASALLAAYAAQVKAGSADALRAAAADRAAELEAVQTGLAAVAHSAALAAEVAAEETAKQIAQRQAAMRSQREALLRAMRDMRTDEAALVARIKDEQSHAEAAFLAEHVEPVHPAATRGGGGGANPAAMLDAHLATMVDVDTAPGRVDTEARVRRVLASYHDDYAARAAAAAVTLSDAARGAAEAAVEAEIKGADAPRLDLARHDAAAVEVLGGGAGGGVGGGRGSVADDDGVDAPPLVHAT